MTNLVLARDPAAKRQLQMLFCAKAKRQLQSAQPGRKSTTRYGESYK
ncbi:hypothetical protein LAV73_09510 [Lysinibacillus xylanilyticus]|nr:hypothetical protein [Lysinibacillus xylanilyticus]MEB2280230.1 hypothetical protein [Lysinibacillus xylanilyticus]